VGHGKDKPVPFGGILLKTIIRVKKKREKTRLRRGAGSHLSQERGPVRKRGENFKGQRNRPHLLRRRERDGKNV